MLSSKKYELIIENQPGSQHLTCGIYCLLHILKERSSMISSPRELVPLDAFSERG